MSHPPTSARQLKELLVYRIAQGVYPVGSRMPGTRELALDIEANRNTVAKAYAELARDGLLQIVKGRGAFVVGRVDTTAGQEPADQVARTLDDAIIHARLFGFSRDAIIQLAEERVHAIFDEGAPRLGFVECNPYDAELVAGELSTQLGTHVLPLLIEDIAPSGAMPFDVAATSFFHLEEVERLLTGRVDRVVGVNTLPDPEALLALARLTAGTHVGVVAANDTGVERFSLLVRTYCRAVIRSLVTPSDASLDEMIPWADVMVTSLSCSPQVKARAGDKPVITLAFHVDPQSVQYLRSRVLIAGPRKVAAP